MQILLEPENKVVTLDRAGNVCSLLSRLGIRPGQALVIRDRELLTPDRRLTPEDKITIRKIVSRG